MFQTYRLDSEIKVSSVLSVKRDYEHGVLRFGATFF